MTEIRLTGAQRRLLAQLAGESRPINGYGPWWRPLDTLCNLGFVHMRTGSTDAGKFEITQAGRQYHDDHPEA